MKRILSFSLLAFGVITMLVSCGTKNYLQEEGFCTATPEGDSVVFGYNSAVSLFTGCKENIQAKVTGITDSRCPVGVTCVWAGKLSVVLQMDSLRITLEKDKVIDTFYRDNRYSFNLVDALPLPAGQNGAETASQKVYINIIRGNRSQPVTPDNTLPIASDSTKKPNTK